VNKPRPAADPDSFRAAYLRGLRWLTARELSESQVRARLLERGFSEKAVDEAVDRLLQEGTIDDRRAAATIARLEARVRRHGPRRVAARLLAMQLDRDLVREVVNDIFAGDQERELLEASLDRRLRGKPELLKDPRERRRVHAHLVRQGFSVSAASSAIRNRTKP
jgi:regulatory protein